jgi:3-phosphoshikimate 1-carboxyvinyltransferase
VRIAGGGLPGGEAAIDASRSSQFVSAVLLAAPHADRDVRLRLAGVLVSRPYVELTLEVMRAFGAEAGFAADDVLEVAGRRGYRARAFAVEPDASSAVYPLAAAAIAGGRVRVPGLSARSAQADVRVVDVLEQMGCEVTRGADFLEVRRRDPERPLAALDVDLNALPDAALTLAVVALFADGPSTLRNLANLRLKESDRLAALETEIRRLGGGARVVGDALRVEPGPLRGAVIETYDDHRIAMAFALAGLRVPGVAIRDPGCVRKTWPDYFAALERL